MTVATPSPKRSPRNEEIDRQLHELFQGAAGARTPSQDAALLDAAIEAAETPRPLDSDRRRLEAALGRGFPRAA